MTMVVPVRAFRARGMSGFTLLELIVVMALLSLIMLGLGSAMHAVGHTQERVNDRIQRSDDMRVSSAFIRTALGRVSARRIQNAGIKSPETSEYWFAAAPDAMQWVGVMPARFGAGGRYFFRLGIEAVDGGNALVVRFAPWEDLPSFPDLAPADSRVLAYDVTSFAIRYEDGRTEPPVWSAQWADATRLPSRVAMEIGTGSETWPVVVVPMRPLPMSSRSGSDFVIGGTR